MTTTCTASPSAPLASAVRGAYICAGAASGVFTGALHACKELTFWVPGVIAGALDLQQRASMLAEALQLHAGRVVGTAYAIAGVGSGLFEGGLIFAKTVTGARPAATTLVRCGSGSSMDGAVSYSSGYTSSTPHSPEPERCTNGALANGDVHAFSNGNGIAEKAAIAINQVAAASGLANGQGQQLENGHKRAKGSRKKNGRR